MKVTGEVQEVRGSIKAMMRGPVLFMLEEWGFTRPDKLDFNYDIRRGELVMTLQYGGQYVKHAFRDSHVHPMELQIIAEHLAQNACVPIAEEL